MKKIYCIDTSFFISCWHEYYQKEFFGTEDFFQLFIKKSKEYNFYIHQQVYAEIDKKTDGLSKWFSESKHYFHKVSERQEQEIADCGTKIIKKYKNLSKADHFIIASAKILKATVVSDEKKGQMPKSREAAKTIPAVCENEEIACSSVFDFMEEIKIIFN